MGTDIHLFVEQQRPDGVWICLPQPIRDLVKYPRDPKAHWSHGYGPFGCIDEGACHYCTDRSQRMKLDDPPKMGSGCERCAGSGREMEWYASRHYQVFAILAGVRNYHDIVPIAECRGWPDDRSETLKVLGEQDHTNSWLSLPELLAYDWKAHVSVQSGTIPMCKTIGHYTTNYEEWREQKPFKSPESYCRSVGGGNTKTLTMAEADTILMGFGDRNKHDYYVEVSWATTYAEMAADFVAFVNEMLVPLGDPERVRIVFGFDS